MVREWFAGLKGLVAAGTFDAANTKEDAEVLNGLFIGRKTHQIRHDLYIVQRAKIFDLL